jgi:hypothetical protein
MSFAIPDAEPQAVCSVVHVKAGRLRRDDPVCGDGGVHGAACTSGCICHPSLGMMSGLGLLMIHGISSAARSCAPAVAAVPQQVPDGLKPARKPFDMFISAKRVEWDTLLFFYGVVISVGGLGALSATCPGCRHDSYAIAGPSTTNVAGRACVGHRRQHPDHVRRAGDEPRDVARPLAAGHAHGRRGRLAAVHRLGGRGGPDGPGARHLHFHGHLRWIWAIALGYAASIWVHLNSTRRPFDAGHGGDPPGRADDARQITEKWRG